MVYGINENPEVKFEKLIPQLLVQDIRKKYNHQKKYQIFSAVHFTEKEIRLYQYYLVNQAMRTPLSYCRALEIEPKVL